MSQVEMKTQTILQKIKQIINKRNYFCFFDNLRKAIFDFLSEISLIIQKYANSFRIEILDDIFKQLNIIDAIIDNLNMLKWTTFDNLYLNQIDELKKANLSIAKDIQEICTPLQICCNFTDQDINEGLKKYYYFFGKLTNMHDCFKNFFNEISICVKKRNILIEASQIQENYDNYPNNRAGESSDKDTEEEEESNNINNNDEENLEIEDNDNINLTNPRESDFVIDYPPLIHEDKFKIYTCTYERTGEKMTLTQICGQKSSEKFNRLKSVLEKIQNPNIEEFFCIIPDKFSILTRRNGETLDDFLLNLQEPSNSIQKVNKTKIAFEIASAMAFLHSRNVIHRDLNSSNVLLDENDNPRVINFTSSRFAAEKGVFHTLQGKLNLNSFFRAPELLSNESYDREVDVFAFGGILYHLLTGKQPFCGESKNDVIRKIQNGERPKLPGCISEKLNTLIELCWRQDPSERPSFYLIVDMMLINRVCFPNDDEKEVKDFYDGKSVRVDDVANCLNSFSQTIDAIEKKCKYYQYQWKRVQTILFGYHFILRTSPYTSSENICQKSAWFGYLNAYLIDLNSLMEQSNEKRIIHNSFFNENVSFSPTDIVDDIYQIMEQIYKLIKDKLDLKVIGYRSYRSDLRNDIQQVLYLYDRINHTKQIKKIINEENKNQKIQNVNLKEQILRIKGQINKYKEDIPQYFKLLEYEVNPTQNESIEAIRTLFLPYHEYFVNRKDFTIIEKIGKGATSIVYKAKHKNGKYFAVKEIQDFSLEYLNYLRREISFCIDLHHEYFLNFVGFNAEVNKSLMLVYDLKRKSLFEAIKNNELSPLQLTRIAFQIALGMEHLHSMNIIHRDLKTLNILLDENNVPAICDFGYSVYNLNLPLERNVGTILYMAPEVRGEGSCCYGLKVDVFSFGTILYEIYSRLLKNFNENMEKAIIIGSPLSFTADIQEKLKELIIKCRNYLPKDRLSFTDILKTMVKDKVCFPGANEREVTEFYNEQKRKRPDLIPK